MQHESMTLTQEKACLEEMKKLRAARRAVVAAAGANAAAAPGDDGSRAGAIDRIKAADERLNAIKAEEEAAKAELTAARAADAPHPGAADAPTDIGALIAARNEARASSEEAYNKIKALRAEFKAGMDAWWASEKEFRAWRAVDRKVKDAAWAVEKAARDAERAARRAEFAGEPFDREVSTCDQLAAYLAAATGQANGAVTTAAAPAAPAAPTTLPPGCKPLAKKPDVVADLAAFAGDAGAPRGKAARARAAKAKAAPVAAPEEAAKKRLPHTLESMAAFASVGVAVPLTAGDAAAAVKALDAAKAGFLARREKVKANGGVDPDAPPKPAKKDKAAAKAAPASPSGAPSPASDGAGVSGSIEVGGADAGVGVKLTARPASADGAVAAA